MLYKYKIIIHNHSFNVESMLFPESYAKENTLILFKD